MPKKSSIVPAFEKIWDETQGRWRYLPRPCPYCVAGKIKIGDQMVECAACDGTNRLFRDGFPDLDEKLLAAAPTVYRGQVQKWSLSVANVGADTEELPF